MAGELDPKRYVSVGTLLGPVVEACELPHQHGRRGGVSAPRWVLDVLREARDLQHARRLVDDRGREVEHEVVAARLSGLIAIDGEKAVRAQWRLIGAHALIESLRFGVRTVEDMQARLRAQFSDDEWCSATDVARGERRDGSNPNDVLADSLFRRFGGQR